MSSSDTKHGQRKTQRKMIRTGCSSMQLLNTPPERLRLCTNKIFINVYPGLTKLAVYLKCVVAILGRTLKLNCE